MKTDSRMACAVATALLLTLATTAATEAVAGANAAKPHRKSVRATSGRDSGETVSERERRLYRECRGRPNAGACEGYAR